ncbi:coth protein-domain-containing protein [Thamnidium elegans]|nr:coth protein-domain-containing protein [Thamnidium elegans]
MFISILAIPLLLSALNVNAQQQNITYNVIASPYTSDQSVVVVVDNTVWPLTSTLGIMYQGTAPIAQTEYHYAILESNQQVNTTEEFTRSPVSESTVNEFFNREKNSYQINSLPNVITPLSSINRIQSDLHIDGQIPTIHIWGNTSAVSFLHEKQLEDVDVELNFTYIGLQEVQTFENVKVSLAGRSSRYVPKLSYGLKMKKKSDDNLFGYKNLKLRAFGMDPSYIRECVSYSTLKAAGLPASGFSYVRLFINNKPIGLYGLIETFQDPWVASQFAGGDKNYASGYLYQGVTAGDNPTIPVISNLDYYTNLSYYNAGEYKIKAGPSKKNDEDYTRLQSFTKFIQDANAETTIEEWGQQLDTDGFLRSMALENLLGFSDAYMTLSNNFYLYSDPKSSGQLVFFAADLDTTLGISLFEINLMLSGNYTEHPGFTFQPLTKKFFSYDAFTTPYQELLLNLTNSLVNPTIMNPFIDSVVTMITQDVKWDNALPKVGVFQMPPVVNETTDAADAFSLFPPGLRMSWTEEVPQTFESAVTGPSNSTTMESVKDFIAKKSQAIIAFYNN